MELPTAEGLSLTGAKKKLATQLEVSESTVMRALRLFRDAKLIRDGVNLTPVGEFILTHLKKVGGGDSDAL